MATKNAIDSSIPIVVSKGGSGNVSLTDHSVLVGSGTAAITAIAVGGTGEILVASTGADPALSSSSDGDFTFTSSTTGVARVLTVENTDNSSLTSNARINITVGGSGAGDPHIDFEVDGDRNFYISIDNSEFDHFSIGQTLSTSDFSATVNGEITKGRTPAFLAHVADGDHQLDVTGDGTIYSYTCGTEIFDQNAGYNTGTGQFTAPISGRYMLIAGVRLSGVVPAGADQFVTYINTSNRIYINGDNRAGYLGDYETQCVTIADMDQGDVAYPQVSASGGAKTVAVFGTTSTLLTFFAGYLAC